VNGQAVDWEKQSALLGNLTQDNSISAIPLMQIGPNER
jgi:hypothetical protein